MEHCSETAFSRCLSNFAALRPVPRRRLPHPLAEYTVEMGERLEADFVCYFAYPQVRIEQKILGLLDSHTGQIISEIKPGRFLEHFAKIESAGIHRAGHLRERKIIGLMAVNELSGARDRRRLGVSLLDGDSVAQQRQMLAEDSEQPGHRLVLAGRQDARVKIRLFKPVQIH